MPLSLKSLMRRVIVATMPVCLLAGCPAPDEGEERIVLGMLNPLTGGLAAYAPALENGAQLAVRQLNEAGGVLGKTLALDVRDSKTEPDVAAELAQAFVDEGFGVVIGDAPSGGALAAAEVTSAAGVVQITGSATSPELTSFADQGYLFRTVPSDAFQGVVLARQVYEDGHRNVAILHLDNTYGAGLAGVFTDEFTALGGTVDTTRIYPENPPETYDFAGDLGAATAADPDAVLLVSYADDGTRFLQAWASDPAAFQGQWYLTDGMKTEDVIANVGSAAVEGIKGTAPVFGAGAGFDPFAAAYQEVYGEAPGIFADNFYDAVMLVALAMSRAGSEEPSAIRDALTEVSVAPGTAVEGSKISAALTAATSGDVDYVGASGPVDLDENGDVAGPVEVWRIEGGAIVQERIVEP